MRIRKRFPPPSDPQLNTKNESLPSDLPNLSLPQPSDQPATVTGAKTTTSWVLFGGNNNNPPKIEQKDVEDEDGKLWREKKEIIDSNIDNDHK
uniref:Uncharacterized protein n=2 Tax=Solanum TaxID=4107 RepID=M1C6I9_SOLTU